MQLPKQLFFICIFLFGCSLSVQAAKRGPFQRGMYDPTSSKTYRLSRSRLELFLECPRCFYLACRLGKKRPEGFPFTLNNAVDENSKRDFDVFRVRQIVHPILEKENLPFIPFDHPGIEDWREARNHGLEYSIPGTNIMFCGGIDDLWIDKILKKLVVVDYKATSKKDKVNLNAPWQIVYKHQAEMYQWLADKMLPEIFPEEYKEEYKEEESGKRHDVSDIAYFVYYNARKDVGRFIFKELSDGTIRDLDYNNPSEENIDDKPEEEEKEDDKPGEEEDSGKSSVTTFEFIGVLKFDISLLPYDNSKNGRDGFKWVGEAIMDAYHCLRSDEIPPSSDNCKYCNFVSDVNSTIPKKSCGTQTEPDPVTVD